MPFTEPSRFTCTHCGKEYHWKPQFAGRQVRCLCGQVMVAPANLAGSNEAAKEAGADEDTCPSCSGPLPAGQTLCDKCRAELLTSLMSGAALAESAPAPAPALQSVAVPPSLLYPTPHTLLQEEPDAVLPIVMKYAGLGLLLLVLGAILGGVIVSRSTAPPPRSTAPALGEDALVDALIRDQGASELRQWIKESQLHSLMGMTPEKADRIAQDLYRMGARQVLAFGPAISASLAIELPQDPAKRRALFDWVIGWHESQALNQPRPRDVGQKYLLVRMPM